jgi:thymidylate synthase (FAD)
MEVKLLSYTPEAEKLVAAAARLCYSPRRAASIMENFPRAEAGDFLRKLTDMGHFSPLEHASFTFALDGVSRSLSHQLVRHRIGASFSQKSQRYVTEKQFEYITPPSVAANKPLQEQFVRVMSFLQENYNQLIAQGIPPEDARYILPNACATNLVLTMNARSLLHFFELRCCMRAQEEIRRLAFLMLAEARRAAPALFEKAGPSCETAGICFEGEKSCGKAAAVRSRREEEEFPNG